MTPPRKRPNPADRPVDRLLAALREMAGEYELDRPVYRFLPGAEDVADAWLAACPLHTCDGHWPLLIVDRGPEAVPTLRCRAGCPPSSIRRILDPDPARDREVAELVRAWLWMASTRTARRAA